MSHAPLPRDHTTRSTRALVGPLVAPLAMPGANFIIGAVTRLPAVSGDAAEHRLREQLRPHEVVVQVELC